MASAATCAGRESRAAPWIFPRLLRLSLERVGCSCDEPASTWHAAEASQVPSRSSTQTAAPTKQKNVVSVPTESTSMYQYINVPQLMQ